MGDPRPKEDRDSNAPVHTIILAFTGEPWKLDIKATVENFDMAVSMLDQARRWFMAQIQMQHASDIARRYAEDADNLRIAAAIRNGGR